MADTKWTPYSNIAGLQAGINRMFADVLGFGDDSGRASGFCAWRPPVDVIETEEAYVLHAELPGVKRENLSIEIRDNLMLLSGERKPGEAIKTGRYLRSERIFGRFERSFSISSAVDPEAVRATFKDGVLEVLVPKSGARETRKIDIE
ncbi:MAG: Hsp20/alpha crystallin family protein [Desulfobacterales bacterium]|jgi:HSP20 family protein